MANIKKPIETKEDHSLFNVYYPMEITHYSNRVVSNMTESTREKWTQFINITKKLKRRGIAVYIVPLNFDYSQNIWWADYANDYLARFGYDLDCPRMTVTMKLGDDHKYDSNWYIRIDHNLQTRTNRDIVNNLTSSTNFIEWNGTDEREMRLMLEDEYAHPGYNEYEPDEEDLNNEEPDEEDLKQRGAR
jgi:hypothetical protein